jgi:hypothetical protein
MSCPKALSTTTDRFLARHTVFPRFEPCRTCRCLSLLAVRLKKSSCDPFAAYGDLQGCVSKTSAILRRHSRSFQRLESINRPDPRRTDKKSISGRARSMCGCWVPITAACQELIVQSINLARLIGRDILMRSSQLMLGWLVVVTIANRPWSLVKWLGAPALATSAAGVPTPMVVTANIA